MYRHLFFWKKDLRNSPEKCFLKQLIQKISLVNIFGLVWLRQYLDQAQVPVYGNFRSKKFHLFNPLRFFRDCDLITAGELFGRSGYGVGLQKGSPWADQVTLAILDFHESKIFFDSWFNILWALKRLVYTVQGFPQRIRLYRRPRTL